MGNGNKNNLVYRNSNNKYYVKDDELDINNNYCAPTIIANQIEFNSVILDVGCAQGTLGYYLNKEKNCNIYGIEIDDEARKIAESKNCYDKIYSFSIEDDNNEQYKKFLNNDVKFDYIIFADVLEHLYRPDKIIYEFQKKLNKNGKILISIPNIAHYDIIRGLFNDCFNYSRVGILDNTHIRFFTKKSFVQFIDDINDYYSCNLDLIYIDSSLIIPEYSINYNELNKVIYAKDNINVLQNIFCIKKDSSGKMQNLKKLLKENNIDIFKLLNKKMIEYQEKDQIIIKQQAEINKISDDYQNEMIKMNELVGKQELLLKENEKLIEKVSYYENDKIITFLKKIKRIFKRT